MKEPKFPSNAQLENLGVLVRQAVAHTQITCSRVVELLEDPQVHLEPKVRISLETIRQECDTVLKLWEA